MAHVYIIQHEFKGWGYGMYIYDYSQANKHATSAPRFDEFPRARSHCGSVHSALTATPTCRNVIVSREV